MNKLVPSVFRNWLVNLSMFAVLTLGGRALPADGAHRHVPTSQSTSPPAQWRSISLPYRPVCIAGDGNVLWVGGVDEMLVKSEDGGKTWQVKHQKAGGEVLLSVGLLGVNTVYASGTNGTTL